MPKISLSDAVGILGIIGLIVYPILERAGLLKGNWLQLYLFVAASLTLFVAIGNPFVLEAPSFAWKIWRGALAFCLVGFIYAGIAIALHEKQSAVSMPAPKEETAPGSYKLLFTVTMANLPILVEPKSTAYILIMNPDQDDKFTNRSLYLAMNSGDERTEWPLDVPRGKGASLDPFHCYDFTNHSKETLLDVSILIPTGFHHLVKVPVKYTKKADGTNNLELATKKAGISAGMIAVREINKGSKPRSFEGFYPGELVKSIERVAIIPSIKPGETVRISIVNQSQLVAVAWFPKEASALLASGSRRVSLLLVNPKVTPREEITYCTFAPSAYKWKGVPGF